MLDVSLITLDNQTTQDTAFEKGCDNQTICLCQQITDLTEGFPKLKCQLFRVCLLDLWHSDSAENRKNSAIFLYQ